MNNDKLKEALKDYTRECVAAWKADGKKSEAEGRIDGLLVQERSWWRRELNKLEKAAGGRWFFRRKAPYVHMSNVWFMVDHGKRPMTGRVMCSADLHASHQHGPSVTVHASALWEDREKLLDDLRRIMGVKEKGK